MQKGTPSTYEYIFEEGERKSYSFQTSHGLTYAARFKASGYVFESAPVWADSAYEFFMEVADNPTRQSPPPDSLIPATVVRIFQDFFHRHGEIVLYTCETADGRGAARARKFDGWFRQFNDESFIKADRTLFDPRQNLTYQNSLLLRAGNPYRDEILAAFEALFGGLEAEK